MIELPEDFRDLLVELHDADAEFVVVGGYAVAFHAEMRVPKGPRRCHRLLVELRWHAADPGLFELYSRDRCQDVDAVRGASKLHDAFRRREVFVFEREVAESKLANRVEDSSRVVRRRTHEKVDVASETRVTVKGYGVSANDEVFNRVRVQ